MSTRDMLHKYVIYGGQKVGKASFLFRLAGEEFCESYTPTIGCKVRFKSYYLDNLHCKAEIWTTSGDSEKDDDVEAISEQFLTGSAGK